MSAYQSAGMEWMQGQAEMSEPREEALVTYIVQYMTNGKFPNAVFSCEIQVCVPFSVHLLQKLSIPSSSSSFSSCFFPLPSFIPPPLLHSGDEGGGRRNLHLATGRKGVEIDNILPHLQTCFFINILLVPLPTYIRIVIPQSW